MSERLPVYAGCDVGSSAIKAVLIDGGGAVLHSVLRDTTLRLDEDLAEVERELATFLDDGYFLAGRVSTGYGRRRVAGSGAVRPEIICHGKGVYHQVRGACTVIDIGGQDNKIIRLAADGTVDSFRMNTKCAAGTGAFLEEIANKAHIPLGKLDGLATASTAESAINSFCTVFAMTEVLQRIVAGERLEDIVRGVFVSITERVGELVVAEGEPVILTGGVIAHNPVLKTLLEKRLGQETTVCANPRFTGAVGAALLAMKHDTGEGGR